VGLPDSASRGPGLSGSDEGPGLWLPTCPTAAPWNDAEADSVGLLRAVANGLARPRPLLRDLTPRRAGASDVILVLLRKQQHAWRRRHVTSIKGSTITAHVLKRACRRAGQAPDQTRGGVMREVRLRSRLTQPRPHSPRWPPCNRPQANVENYQCTVGAGARRVEASEFL
jgi:hypothetical protein